MSDLGTSASAGPVVALADMAIQRLFRIGLVLEATATGVDDPGAGAALGSGRDRLEQAVGELDELIRDLRIVAFEACIGDAGTVVPPAPAENLRVDERARERAAGQIERARSLLAAHQPSPQDGAAWWAVETARRGLHGAAIALADSSLGVGR